MTLRTSLLLFVFDVTKGLKPSGAVMEFYDICKILNGNNMIFLNTLARYAVLYKKQCITNFFHALLDHTRSNAYNSVTIALIQYSP